MKSQYIVFEGIVGTGKTTQSKRLAEYLGNKYGNEKVLWTFEPGGSEIAGAIRKVVQGTEFEEKMDPICEAYLYASSRAQTLRTIVKPALDEGKIVIADRSFFTSIAYQGFARGLGIEKVMEINKVAIEETLPDKVLYFDLDIEIGLSRTFDKSGDKFEKENLDFFRKIEQGYKKIAELALFKDRWVNIDGNGSMDEVFERVARSL